MLYEVITHGRCLPAEPSRIFPLLRSNPGTPRPGQAGRDRYAPRPNEPVITSYSIHYTKLYDFAIREGGRTVGAGVVTDITE